MKNAFGILVCIVLLLLAGCGNQAPPATEVALASTETPLPPTATPVPPTATPVPPTETPLPPTATPGPPTATPGPSPTATPTPASCAEAEGICLELTFDGETCTYVGPTDFKQGRVTLIFINASKDFAAMNLVRHRPGYTHQDMLDIFGEDGRTTWSAPSWTTAYGTWKRIYPGKIEVWPRYLYPGIHTMVCARVNPKLIWYGTGLDVGD